MKHRLSFAMITLLVPCLLIGCKLPRDYTEFMKLTEERQKEEFEKLALEKQVDFYLLRSLNSHPSDSSLGEIIAKKGEEAIPYLIERLRTEDKDYNKQFLIKIFVQMHTNIVDLRKRQDVIEVIEDSIKQIKSSHEKDLSQLSLNYIKATIPRYAEDFTNPLPASPPVF